MSMPKVRCTKCSHVFRVPAPAEAPTADGSFPIPLDAFDQPAHGGTARPTLPLGDLSQSPAAPSAEDDHGQLTRMTEEMAAFLDDGFGDLGHPSGNYSGASLTEAFDRPLGDHAPPPLELDERRPEADPLDFDDSSNPFGAPRGNTSPAGGIRGPARAAKGIDPMVEFGDVFREARAEMGETPTRASYLDDDLLADRPRPTGEGPRSPRRNPGDLDLVGGRPEMDAALDPFGGPGRSGSPPRTIGKVRLPRQSATADEASLLDAALKDNAATTLPREQPLPPPPAPAQPALATVLAAKPSGSGADAGATGSTFAASLLTILLVLLGATGYVAHANDGLLDLRELDQMVGVAFRGETYIPRHTAPASAGTAANAMAATTGGSGDGSGETEPFDAQAADDALATEPAGALEVGPLDDGRLLLEDGRQFLVVDGSVTNRSSNTYRRIELEVALLDANGQVIATASVAAGDRLQQPHLAIVGPDHPLERAYDRVREAAAELTVGPRQQTPFTGAFLLEDEQPVTAIARVVSAERQATACWTPSTFRPGTPTAP
jgi:hypothetical protein